MDHTLRGGIRLLAGLGLVALAFALDPLAYGALRTITLYDHWGEMREALTTAKFLGSGLGTAVVALAVAMLDRRGWRRALALLMVVAATTGASGLIKVLTGRERPSHLDQVPGQERAGFHGPDLGLTEAPFQSFPSGHTAAAFASATSLARFYPPAAAVFYTVAGATAVNRVVKHQHFLSDAVAGAVLGHLLALFALARGPVHRLWNAATVDTVGPGP